MSIDFGKNQATADALDAYLALENPQFAALINSKWGSGKTWFARKYLEHAKKGVQDQVSPDGEQAYDVPAFCYVSLFDIVDNKEIDAAIMAQMNPVLFSKGGKFAGRIARFVLEKASSFLPVGVTPDDVAKCTGFIKELCCRRPQNLVVVLDDLERTRLPAELVLGYVSDLLEEADAKIILLCNEEEILDENKEIFLKFREKVVGLTLSVVPDIDSVFSEFIDGVDNSEFVTFFNAHQQEIINIFDLSRTQNLRHIRRIGHEFLRIFQSLQNEMKGNKDYVSSLLMCICIFSIEINSRKLNFSDFDVVETDTWIIHNGFKDSILHAIMKKYSFSLWKNPVSPKFIKTFFYHGVILKEEITSSYKFSKYNNDKDSIPTPLQIWYFFDMDDSTANSLYQKMKKEISENIYKSPGIILHAFSISLSMSDIGIEKKDKQTIVASAKEYIKNIDLEISEKDIDIFEYPTHSYASLGFHSEESDEFKEIFEVMRTALERKLDEERNKSIFNSYKHLPEHVDAFLEKFPFGSTSYVNRKFNADNIDIQDFAKRISALQQPDISKVMKHILNVIQKHYEYNRNEDDIQHWVITFCAELQRVSETMPPLAGWRLKHYVVNLQNLAKQYTPPPN